MSNNKQSIIDWLVSQLKISTYWDTLIAELEFMDLEIDDIIEKAKAMHKEEIIDFGNDLLAQNDINYIGIPNLAEQYYNDTYDAKK